MELGVEGGVVEGGVLGAVEDAGAVGVGFWGGSVGKCALVCISGGRKQGRENVREGRLLIARRIHVTSAVWEDYCLWHGSVSCATKDHCQLKMDIIMAQLH